MLDSDLTYLDEKHYCPHCKKQLSCCHAPPFHVGDGLGWGSEILFICLNDNCSLYVNGWKFIEEQFGHVSSYRYMLVPGEKEGTTMMVAGKDAFKDSEVDPESIKMQNKRYAAEKEALAKLDTCVAEKNLEPVLHLILDDAANQDGRKRACELLCEINDISCIDPIRNHKFKNESIESAANMSIQKILKTSYKKECPYCCEIIKAQAKVCLHCKRDLA